MRRQLIGIMRPFRWAWEQSFRDYRHTAVYLGATLVGFGLFLALGFATDALGPDREIPVGYLALWALVVPLMVGAPFVAVHSRGAEGKRSAVVAAVVAALFGVVLAAGMTLGWFILIVPGFYLFGTYGLAPLVYASTDQSMGESLRTARAISKGDGGRVAAFWLLLAAGYLPALLLQIVLYYLVTGLVPQLNPDWVVNAVSLLVEWPYYTWAAICLVGLLRDLTERRTGQPLFAQAAAAEEQGSTWLAGALKQGD